jgi:dipeptidyl aminopeptidase/acylaminoacyl peptidase
MLRRFRVFFFVLLTIGFLSTCKHKTEQVPLIDFFKTPQKSFFKLSPDGKYVSYLAPFKDKQNLFIESLADGKERMITSFTNAPIKDYYWTFNDGIVFTQDLITEDEYKLFTFNVTNFKTNLVLTENKVKIRLLNRNRLEPDIVNITMNKRDASDFDVYRLNTKTGELTPYLVNPGNITEWYPDPDGTIRLVKASDGVNESILYRADDKSPFKSIIVNNFKDRVDPIAFSGEKDYFYALSNVNRDKMTLVEIDAATGKEVKVIYGNNEADILQIEYSKKKHRIEFAQWEAGRPQQHFLDSGMQSIYRIFLKELKGNVIKIVDRDSAENKFIINSYTDRNPGEYYLFERGSGKLTKLGDVNSSINPDDMCAMQPISYKAHDGMLINGYLTLPKGGKKTNLPVVVMPHDWPNVPLSRNYWGYNPDVQFLANRGYAVFQVNYRGSTGYGKAFRIAGFKQIGGKIQDDITDGTNWLINNNIADPKKIAIFGGGVGGFSALYGASFHPGLYNCIIVQYGVINFFTYIKDFPPYLKPTLQMMYEMVGNPETDANQLRAISPVFHTDKINVPVLIFQGAKDPRANISELNQFVIELHKRNVPVEYILKDNERAFFRNENNRMQMYTGIEQFLDKNMRVKQ